MRDDFKIIIKSFDDKKIKLKASNSVSKDDFKDIKKGIKELAITNGPTRIENNALRNRQSMKKVELADSIEYIGDKAFYNCKELEDIYLPENLSYVSLDAFYLCKSLKFNEYENGQYLGSKNNPYLLLMNVIDGEVEEFNIHPDCRFIFALFAGTKIKEINIPSKVKEIHDIAFGIGTSLEKINVDKDNPYFLSEDGVLYSKDKKTLLAIPYLRKEPYIIPIEVENIECKPFGYPYLNYNTSNRVYYLAKKDNPFFLCVGGNLSDEKEIKLENGTEIIGPNAFVSSDYSVEKITFPNSVKVISKNAFLKCWLKEVNLNDGLEYIGENAFLRTTHVKEYKLYPSIKEIGSKAFDADDMYMNALFLFMGNEGQFNKIKLGESALKMKNVKFMEE
ncbi:MAG: leucine-rich repeat domain-containing protein [Bacilli bacterium]|nr:leucine-rich repeat domain-containing protein [Bacilli bacterium]